MKSLIKEKIPNHSIAYEQEFSHTTWLEIDKKALEHNIASYKKIVAPALLAVVVKSNAYGHGIQQVATICDQSDAVDVLCVVSLSEALSLRSHGITKQLLVLSIIDGNLQKAFQENIDLVLYSMKTALELNRIGTLLNKKINVHIKIDTGLSRLGLLLDDALTFIKKVHQLPFITIRGIFTHFADSENEDQTFANLQLDRFNFLLKELEALNIVIPLKHSSCSAAASSILQSHFTMARVGIGLYGLWPSDDNKKLTQKMHPAFSLQPVLSWKTKIMHIKEVPAETFVGYDRTFQTKRITRIATIPVGYWDGLDRKLSSKGNVVIKNQLARIVGRIAMNLCMVDVTGLDVSLDDEVILLGNYPGITADDLAYACDTINYEIVTRINPLLPRIVRE